MSPITVPQEYQKAPDPLKYSDVIQLPFTAPIISWRNGNPAYKPEDGALFFGGWECSADRLDAAYTGDGYPPLSMFGTSRTVVSHERVTYTAYFARFVYALPIITRHRWEFDKRKPDDKGYGHDQILVYLADRGKDKLVPWGPAILSATSHSARLLQVAFKEFEKGTAEARKEFAGNAKPWFFYHKLGTFEKEPVEEIVGKEQKSSITPCHCQLPKDKLTEQYLTALYPGDDILAICVDLRNQAKEWLEAWKSTDQSKKPEQGDSNPEWPEGDEPPFEDTSGLPF